MPPFDPVALLVMLQAFYPTVSRANIDRARAQRPEYFAGGVLYGPEHDILLLPSGTVYFLVSAGWYPWSHWKIERRADYDDPEPDPFPLEEGPLPYLEWLDAPPLGNQGVFEAMVGGAMESLGAVDALLDDAGQRVTEGGAAVVAMDAGGTEFDDVDTTVAEIDSAHSAQELADVVAQADGISGAIESTDADYDEPPPQPGLPSEPGIPVYPGEDGDDGEPGRENPRHPEHPGPTHPGGGG